MGHNGTCLPSCTAGDGVLYVGWSRDTLDDTWISHSARPMLTLFSSNPPKPQQWLTLDVDVVDLDVGVETEEGAEGVPDAEDARTKRRSGMFS